MQKVIWYKGDNFKDWLDKNFDFDGWWVPVVATLLSLGIGIPLVYLILDIW